MFDSSKHIHFILPEQSILDLKKIFQTGISAIIKLSRLLLHGLISCNVELSSVAIGFASTLAAQFQTASIKQDRFWFLKGLILLMICLFWWFPSRWTKNRLSCYPKYQDHPSITGVCPILIKLTWIPYSWYLQNMFNWTEGFCFLTRLNPIWHL
jgi:hypothetical protein